MKNKKSLALIILAAGALVVLVLVGIMFRTSYHQRQNTQLYDEGREAFLQGHYDEAYQALKNYVAADPNHEETWKMLAEIEESRNHWLAAAVLWQHLSRLNVLEDEYVRNYVLASYRCHDYQVLFSFLEKSDPKWRSEYAEIYALCAFKNAPNDEKTAKLAAALPAGSAIGQLIQVLKNNGPAEDIAKLENADDPVLQVEAFILDGYLAEFKDKDLKRAETCLTKAAAVNPFLCQCEYGNFLFRHRRYEEAFTAYSRDDILLSLPGFLNYAETAYEKHDSATLEQIGKKLNSSYPKSIPELAYVHALKAHLDGDVERMKANFLVANQPRRTPMSMRLRFAAAIANRDVQLLAQSLKYIATSPSFAERRQPILKQITPILQANSTGKHMNTAAQIAELFMDVEPANELVWQIVILNNWRKKTLPPEMLQKAIKLFPTNDTFRQLALLQAQGDATAVSQAFDQWIAVSKEPTIVRFRKVSFLLQSGKTAEATAEVIRMAESDPSLLASKLCLLYGLQNGNRTAIEQAGKRQELKPLVAFELERLYGNRDEAVRQLQATRLEDAFTVKQPEDRPILLSMAVYLAIAREIDRAIAVYEQLKPIATGDATVELNLSELYAAKGAKDKALENAKSALHRFPNSRLVRAIYGLRCAESADFTEAIAFIPDSVQDSRLNGALAFCLEKLIAANFDTGNLFIVREHLARLQKVRPDSTVIAEYTKKLAEREAKTGK